MLSKKVAAIGLSVMWSIWNSGNKYTDEEVKFQPLKSVELVDEVIRALEIPPEQAQTERVRQVWKPPDQGWIKLNTDGAIDQVS
jgi:hypothetical protein